MSTNQDKTKVTRIKASDAKPAATKPMKKSASVKTSAKTVKSDTKSRRLKRPRSFGALGKLGGYFKGAWVELRQVHWPTRSATWGLTGAVLLFSAFFVVFITLLDVGFKYLFEQILR